METSRGGLCSTMDTLGADDVDYVLSQNYLNSNENNISNKLICNLKQHETKSTNLPNKMSNLLTNLLITRTSLKAYK